MASAATASSARSAPARSTRPRPPLRPRADCSSTYVRRAPASAGSVSSTAEASATPIDTRNAPRSTAGSSRTPDASIHGSELTSESSGGPRNGATSAHGIATSRASPPASAARRSVPAPRERSSATSMRRWSASSRAVSMSAYAASSTSWSTGMSMVDRATSEAVPSCDSISGRRLSAVQEAQPFPFSPARSAATRAANGRSSSGVSARRSGTAVQVALTFVAKRARNVSRGTISGPYVANSPTSTPRARRCSPAQRSPNGSLSWKTPTTRTVTGSRSRRPSVANSWPASQPAAEAAGSETAASTTSPAPDGRGQEPETSLACRSSSS
ncbi:MAG: hypothetical protein K0R62_7468 [Nonomuraea muscovyensis]|nr:hypothetical protein [Nonomuraea muscovyensis]